MKKGPQAFLERAHKSGSQSKKTGDAHPPRIHMQLSQKTLIANYRALLELGRTAGRSSKDELFLLPMLKANAYGHGMEWVARALAEEEHLMGFGVATLEEGMRLRKCIGPKGRRRIVVFSGTTPWNERAAEICESHRLTAVLSSEADVRLFLRRRDYKQIPYELFFNTGMNRLGIPVSLTAEIARELEKLAPEQRPEGVLSHLADAENPQSKLSQAQFSRWQSLRRELGAALPNGFFHLGNSAALWNAKHWDLASTELARPGLSLYGVPPWKGAALRGIEPVMRVLAPVLQTHRLKPGDSIGYGGTYTVKGDAAVHVAILDAGYADGVPRLWSNRGQVHWTASGAKTRFVGVVSMDLCAVHCSPQTKPGDWVELWGPSVDAWAQAKEAETIPYEIMTSFSERVARNPEYSLQLGGAR